MDADSSRIAASGGALSCSHPTKKENLGNGSVPARLPRCLLHRDPFSPSEAAEVCVPAANMLQ